MKKDNIFLAIWRCLYPLLIHLAVTFGLGFAYIFVGIFLVVFQSAGGGEGTTFAEVMNSYMENALYLLLAASVICIPVFALLFRADRKKEQSTKERETSITAWLLLAVIAVALCVSLNALIGFSGIEKFSKGYQQAAETLYSGGIFLELITVGILGPVCEELIFRGLMFQRLCGYMKPMIAVLISALLFGMYHGNIVQGIYAFILGAVMALCYLRFQTLWAPILIHVVANITSVCITEIAVIGDTLEKANVLIVATIITTIIWILGIWFLLKKNFRDKLV